jgi:hypothetical protein
MWRYLVGAASMLMMMTAGLLVWSGMASKDNRIPPPPQLPTLVAPSALPEAAPEAPQASEETREQKRFSRADHDKNGKIGRDEYLLARHRNFDKLDSNHDGRLSFDEYATKAEIKFATADADKSGTLDSTEFATTKVVRKIKPRCPPARQAAPAPADAADDDNG